jgi:tubulin gamma
VEPYNAILTTKRLIEDVNAVVCIDNEALQHICVETMHQTLPQYSDMNYLISLVMNGSIYTIF